MVCSRTRRVADPSRVVAAQLALQVDQRRGANQLEPGLDQVQAVAQFVPFLYSRIRILGEAGVHLETAVGLLGNVTMLHDLLGVAFLT